jgi:hypothetical protein
MTRQGKLQMFEKVAPQMRVRRGRPPAGQPWEPPASDRCPA